MTKVAIVPLRLIGKLYVGGFVRALALIDYLDYESSSSRRHPHMRPKRT
jgi:hypothetical protein